MGGLIGKTVRSANLWRLESTPEPTSRQKAAGFVQKAAGFGRKAAGFINSTPWNFLNVIPIPHSRASRWSTAVTAWSSVL